MSIRNKTLYEKIKKFITSSIRELDSFASKETLPGRHDYLSGGVQIDYSIFIFKHFQELDKLPEFLDCAKYILKNPITRKATGWRDKEGNVVKDLPLKLDYFRILYGLLGSCVSLSNGFVFNEAVYEKVYRHFEKGVYSSFLVHELTAPVEGIFGDFEEINFGNKIMLRPITDEEKNSYIQQFSFPYPTSLPVINIDNVGCVLEGIYTHGKDAPKRTSTVTKEFKEIVTVLRLFKQGRVGFSFVKTKTLTWTHQFGMSYGWGHSRQGRITFNSYELKKSDKPELLRLWRKYKKFRKYVGSSDTGRFFNLAVKWFNMGIEENDYENKMIDFFVSFEALCLPERSELSYRLSNRVALLLGKDCEEADKIRKFMVKAYKIRSKIVHGSKVSPITLEGEKIQLREFTQKVEKYLREVLKVFLVLSGKYGKQADIIELIDKGLHDVKTKKRIQKIVK